MPRSSNRFSRGLASGRVGKTKSKAEQKNERIAARLAEQKRRNFKAGFNDEAADEAFDVANALKKRENKHTFRSADYWKQKCALVMKEIDEEHQGAPVTRDTMIKILKKVAYKYTSDLIESLDSDFEPSMKELWTTILREREEDESRYIAGDWVEFLDDDMTWKLGKVVTAAFREVEDMRTKGVMIPYDRNKSNDSDDKDENVNYFYKVSGTKRHIAEADLRASEEGLVRLFGAGPWIWQQYVLLKLERSLRIQEGHRNDFENFDSIEYADNEWQDWVGHCDNADFRNHFNHRLITNDARQALKDHILMPIRIMEKIVTDEPGWDVVESTDFGVFTYSNHFGTGMTIPIIVALIQWAIPCLLVYNTLIDNPYTGNTLEDLSRYVFCINPDGATQMETLLTTAMVLCIQLLYTTQVVTDQMLSFLTSLGLDFGVGTYNVYYRFNALRIRVRESRRESFGQSVGYTLDLLMNTFYVCVLYMVNIFNILQAAQPFEVLLNSLALEFVGQIDEEFASSTWWDPDRRWMKAAGVKLVLQAHIETELLQSKVQFSQKYNLDKNVLKGVGGGDAGSKFMKNKEQAGVDCRNYRYMTEDERLDFDLAELALEAENEKALSQFKKKPDFFSDIDHFFLSPFFELRGVFKQYVDYRTWSLWDRVLFVAELPNLEDRTKNNGPAIFKKGEIRERWDNLTHTRRQPFRNFSSKTQSAGSKAFFQMVSTIIFYELGGKIAESAAQGKYGDVIFWLYDAVFEWMSYMIQIIFPLYNITGLLFGFYCMRHFQDWNSDTLTAPSFT